MLSDYKKEHNKIVTPRQKKKKKIGEKKWKNSLSISHLQCVYHWNQISLIKYRPRSVSLFYRCHEVKRKCNLCHAFRRAEIQVKYFLMTLTVFWWILVGMIAMENDTVCIINNPYKMILGNISLQMNWVHIFFTNKE